LRGGVKSSLRRPVDAGFQDQGEIVLIDIWLGMILLFGMQNWL